MKLNGRPALETNGNMGLETPVEAHLSRCNIGQRGVRI
jgi:hypothetical protein